MTETAITTSKNTFGLPNAKQRERIRRARARRDALSRTLVTGAGLCVIAALALIIIFLIIQTLPVFRGASAEIVSRYALEKSADFKPVDAKFDASGQQFFVRYTNGAVYAFDAKTGALKNPIELTLSPETSTHIALADNRLITLSATGELQVVDYHPNQSRTFLTADVSAGHLHQPLRSLQAVDRGGQLTLVAVTAEGSVLLYSVNTSDGPVESNPAVSSIALSEATTSRLAYLSDNGQWLVVSDEDNHFSLYTVGNEGNTVLESQSSVAEDNVTHWQFMPDGRSIISGHQSGALTQWFIERDASGQTVLNPARYFKSMPAAISRILPEATRQGFWVIDDAGNAFSYFATQPAPLIRLKSASCTDCLATVSADSKQLLLQQPDGHFALWGVRNAHPELTFAALWQKVRYEGHAEADYTWQPVTASAVEERKMSLVPLTTGTLKVAFFAMLFAIPVGIMAAIYTAYFMSARARGVVKPSIEMMEALPTVIIGFIAGIWLAPWIELHLFMALALMVLLPATVLLSSFLFSCLPAGVRQKLPGGWETLWLLFPLGLFSVCAIWLLPVIEQLVFTGGLRQWLTDRGIDYQQRNGLVIGIAMGFAIIPTIFTLAEEALFNVPRHLTHGSMALGATAWQTLRHVILPTASAGIFSAVMLGFGRALGETMIVLMATSNSPLSEFNWFDGLRALTATMATELPEAAAGSSHYHVLFFAALLLLVMTLVVNSLAEWIRQTIRKHYRLL